MERDGQREDREGEGEAHGARGAGGGEREAGGERASELETRQRFMGREGSMAAPRWPAGRPLGSCYTARAAAAAQPRRRAHAARRGPRGHDYARGDPELSLPALWRPSLEKGEQCLTGKGAFPSHA